MSSSLSVFDFSCPTCACIIHCRHIAVTSPSHRRHIAVTSPSHRRHIAVTSPSHRRHIAVTSPSHRRHIAGLSRALVRLLCCIQLIWWSTCSLGLSLCNPPISTFLMIFIVSLTFVLLLIVSCGILSVSLMFNSFLSVFALCVDFNLFLNC